MEVMPFIDRISDINSISIVSGWDGALPELALAVESEGKR
jgi:hypothetical protein